MGRFASHSSPARYTGGTTKGAREMTSKRELVSPRGDKRLIRRDEKGRFKESDDLGRSLASDVRRHADHEAKPGQGDRGDRKH